MMSTSISAPVALEREVVPLSLLRANLEGRELVLWRDDFDDVQVWEDRCPHRSVRLSAGRNRGDCLQCAYHGWSFAKNGSVALIPSQTEGEAPDIRVSTYRSKTVDGFVWASLGEEVNVPENFSPGEGDVLLRPLPVNAAAKATQSLLDKERGMTLIATPSGENSCVIFGYSSPEGEPAQHIRRCNHRLNVLRRILEQGTGL